MSVYSGDGYSGVVESERAQGIGYTQTTVLRRGPGRRKSPEIPGKVPEGDPPQTVLKKKPLRTVPEKIERLAKAAGRGPGEVKWYKPEPKTETNSVVPKLGLEKDKKPAGYPRGFSGGREGAGSSWMFPLIVVGGLYVLWEATK